MSLQTKVFTYGSLSSKVFKYYVLELTLSEDSVSQDKNTSEIAYTLKLKTGSNNRFDGRINCTLKLNNTQVATVEKKQMFDYKKTFTLLTGTATVAHSTDGTLDMPIAVIVDTAESNQYSPDDTTIEWEWPLTTIPRASKISSAAAVTLGENCSVKWTPNSKAFRYKLKFTIGDWSKTVGPIHPNTVSAYTYTGYTLPLDIANQIVNDKQAPMTVKLDTFSDSECKNSVGNASKEFTVTVPVNDDTKPTVEMTLSPVSPENFADLYVQMLSRVKATTLEATAKYGATITSTYIKVESKDYQEPYQSSALVNAGTIDVIGYAMDSRGITGSVKQTIEVLPYSIPKLTNVDAYRCTSDGKEAGNGEYLKITATRDYAPVMSGETQKNFCSIQYQYKAENAADYSEPVTILDGADLESNTVITGALLNATFRSDTAYSVQIIAVDSVSSSVPQTIVIHSERVFRHKRAGGKGMGLGGYCEEDELLDVHWNLRARKGLIIGEGENALRLDDFVVKQGETDKWTYRIWASNVVECWGLTHITVPENFTQSGVVYYSEVISEDYPDGLKIGNAQRHTTIANMGILGASIYGSATDKLQFRLIFTNEEMVGKSVVVFMYVKGKLEQQEI